MLPKSVNVTKVIERRINDVLSTQYVVHPFLEFVNQNNLESVFGDYLAMSQAFPFLQAGSQKEKIFDCINTGKAVDSAMEVTAVVGNFLTWDETGGHYVVSKNGMPGLPSILDTEKYFHANLLKKDCYSLFGKEVLPTYTLITRKYLKLLYEGFSSLDPIIRCASMVAFESHAGQMISALWNKVSTICSVERESLIYFATHVGGEDPAEAYHVKMTSKMIEKIVQYEQISFFMEEFNKAYELSYFWCENISQIDEVDN